MVPEVAGSIPVIHPEIKGSAVVLTPSWALGTLVARSGRLKLRFLCVFARRGVTHLPLLWRKEHSLVSNPKLFEN